MNGSISHSSSYAGEAAPEPAPVHKEMTRLKKNREDLHGVIDRLEERLSSVLRPVPPHPVGEATTSTEDSPLSGAIAAEASFVAAASDRIAALLQRLTV